MVPAQTGPKIMPSKAYNYGINFCMHVYVCVCVLRANPTARGAPRLHALADLRPLDKVAMGTAAYIPSARTYASIWSLPRSLDHTPYLGQTYH